MTKYDNVPEYLGDGLYADFDGMQIRLYATDGIDVLHEVYLEPSVFRAFKLYVRNLSHPDFPMENPR